MDNALLTPLRAADYQALRDLRRVLVVEAKTLGPYLPAARLFLKEALLQAEAIGAQDPDAARALLSFARGVSYNIGADTWPGWADGTEIDAAAQSLGAAAAALCLELSERLHEEADRRANAHWLIGAHALAEGDLSAAKAAFERFSALASQTENQLLGAGYLALVNLVGGEPEARARLRAIRSRMAEISSEPWLVRQLTSAENVFAPHAA